MKKTLRKIIAAVFTLSTVMSAIAVPYSASAQTVGKELFPDVGFESSAVGAYVFPTEPIKATEQGYTANAEITEETAYNGTKSMRIDTSTGGGTQRLQLEGFTITPGNIYVVSAAVKADASGEFSIRANFTQSSAWGADCAAAINANSRWQEVKLVATATAKESAGRSDDKGVIHVRLPKTEKVYIDDLSVKEYTAEEYSKIVNTVYSDNFSGYEAGTVLTGGNTPVYKSYSSSIAGTVTNEDARDNGGNSLKCVLNAASSNIRKLNIAEVKKDADYRFSAYVKPCKDNTKNITMYTKVNASGSGDSYTCTLQPGSDWQNISAYVHGSALAAGSTVEFAFNVSGTQGEGFYIDDIKVTEIKLSDSENAVYNSGFELSNNDDNFTSKTYADASYYKNGSDFYTNAAAKASVSQTESRSGSQSLKVENASTDTNVPMVVQRVPVTAGKAYEVSAYIKTETAANFYLVYNPAGGSTVWADKFGMDIPADGQWHKLSTIVTPASGEAIDLKIAMNSGSAGKGQIFYLDDVSVSENGEGENTVISGNLIPSQLSDFEKNDLSGINAASGTTLTAGYGKVRSGKRSLKVSGAAPSFSINNIALESGKKYVLGAYVGSDNQSGTQDEVNFTLIANNGQDEPFATKTSKVIPKGASNESSMLYYTSFVFDGRATAAELNIEYKDNNADSAKNFFIDGLYIKELGAYTEDADSVFANGSFEADVLAPYTAANVSNTKVSVSDDYAATGNNSLRAEQTAAGGSFRISLPLSKANQQYKVSLSVRWEESKKEYNTIYVYDGINGANLKNSASINGASGWTEINADAVSDANGTLTLQIKGNNSDAAAVYYVDNLVIKEYNPQFTINSDTLAYSTDGESFAPAARSEVKAGTYKYTVNVTNPESGAKNILAAAAVYNADNSLVNTATARQTVEKGVAGQNIEAKLTVSSAIAGGYIKTFIWDADTMQPLDDGKIKVLIIGNSITKHDAAPEKGWLGNWGMAATTQANDYVHQLMSKVNAEYENVTFKWENISEYEKYFYDFSKIKTSKYDELVAYDADIIIAAFGANIKNSANEDDSELENEHEFTQADYKKIIDYFNPNSDAKVIAAVTTLTPSANMETIKASAAANGYIVADMSDLTADEYTAKNYAGSSVFASNVTDAVLGHPGDLGMAKMAEMLLPAVKSAIDSL